MFSCVTITTVKMENVCHCKRCPWLFRSRPLLAPTAGLWVNPRFRRLFHRASRAQTQGLRAALCRSRFLPCLTGDAVLSVWTRGPLSESAPPYPRRLRLEQGCILLRRCRGPGFPCSREGVRSHCAARRLARPCAPQSRCAPRRGRCPPASTAGCRVGAWDLAAGVWSLLRAL